MDIDQLIMTGLTEPQARAYALLFEMGEVKPSAVATKLATTRTNAYKVFDRLAEMGLATKHKAGSTFTYKPNNPAALANMASELRAEATARENAVNAAMNTLLTKYYAHTEQPSVEVCSGRQEVADAYRKQISLKEDVYFMHTKSDVSLMGFDTMHEIRTRPGRLGNKRHAIMGVPKHGKINYESHKRSNLDITWSDPESYTAPVEWSVTESSLLIVMFGSQPHAIYISSPVIAAAFLQMWQLLSSLLRQQETHKKLMLKDWT